MRLVPLALCVLGLVACASRQSRATTPSTADAGIEDTPLARRALVDLDTEEGYDRELPFEAMGSVDLSRFEGMYVPEITDAGLGALQVEENVLRFGGFPRSEISPVELIDRDANELLALAIWHEDIDDPGDAALIYLRLRKDADGALEVRFGASAREIWDEGAWRHTPVSRPLAGLDYRPDPSAMAIPFLLMGDGTCDIALELNLRGAYALDLEHLPRTSDPFEDSVRAVLLQRLFGSIAIGNGGIWYAHTQSGLCMTRVGTDAGGSTTVSVEGEGLDGARHRTFIRLTSTEAGITLRFARDAQGLDSAIASPYVRTGDFESVMDAGD